MLNALFYLGLDEEFDAVDDDIQGTKKHGIQFMEKMQRFIDGDWMTNTSNFLSRKPTFLTSHERNKTEYSYNTGVST